MKLVKGRVQPICETCGWRGDVNPFGRVYDETESQAEVSAVLQARLEHLCPTATRDSQGKIVLHEVRFEKTRL